jgi:hypothetical protein
MVKMGPEVDSVCWQPIVTQPLRFEVRPESIGAAEVVQQGSEDTPVMLIRDSSSIVAVACKSYGGSNSAFQRRARANVMAKLSGSNL